MQTYQKQTVNTTNEKAKGLYNKILFEEHTVGV